MEIHKLPDPEFMFGHEAPRELTWDRRASNASPSAATIARQHPGNAPMPTADHGRALLGWELDDYSS
jgi:hypothetical protein